MTEQSGVSESIRIAHLTMLQGVMARMGSNSFALKALSATFGSAAIAIMATAQKPSPYYAVAAIVPILIFWLMDAQYLRKRPACPLCRECCVEDSVHYRIMDTIGVVCDEATEAAGLV